MHILVVEDEHRMATALRRGLEADGHTVDTAHTGPEGLALADRHPYDVILLDIMLPGLNGYRVCARLRANGCRAGILMLTAKDGEWDEAEALDTGADDYLSKPFSFVVLLARLRALHRRIDLQRPRLHTLGDLVIDANARTCTRAGTPTHLTAREFAILEHLAARAGTVVSKREILDHVWDAGHDTDPSVVEVHIHALRRKIDAPFGRAALQTMRGAGYRLDPAGG